MVGERSRKDLDTDRMLQLSLTHLVEIIGEAASRVSREGRAQHQYIPWQDAINTRNRFIHGYDSVDYDIVWQIATRELPASSWIRLGSRCIEPQRSTPGGRIVVGVQ